MIQQVLLREDRLVLNTALRDQKTLNKYLSTSDIITASDADNRRLQSELIDVMYSYSGRTIWICTDRTYA